MPRAPRLLAGLARFREEMRDHYDSLFAQLADGQHPHTMFITCADRRIDPALLMGSHPGDLFVVRAIGALLVARAGSTVMLQEGAALEYGVGVLGVRTIAVCGHSNCGAISALAEEQVPEELSTLHTWSIVAVNVAWPLDRLEPARVEPSAQLVEIARQRLHHHEPATLGREQRAAHAEQQRWRRQERDVATVPLEQRRALPLCLSTLAPCARRDGVFLPRQLGAGKDRQA